MGEEEEDVDEKDDNEIGEDDEEEEEEAEENIPKERNSPKKRELKKKCSKKGYRKKHEDKCAKLESVTEKTKEVEESSNEDTETNAVSLDDETVVVNKDKMNKKHKNKEKNNLKTQKFTG